MSNSSKRSQGNRPSDVLRSSESALSNRRHEYGTGGIAVRGSLDVSNASEMRTAIVDSVLRRCQRLDLDLSQVTFLDFERPEGLGSSQQTLQTRGRRPTSRFDRLSQSDAFWT